MCTAHIYAHVHTSMCNAKIYRLTYQVYSLVLLDTKHKESNFQYQLSVFHYGIHYTILYNFLIIENFLY